MREKPPLLAEDAMTYDLSCFKAYDIRGRVPDALNPDLARALGQAVADVLGARSVVLGRDARLSGPKLRDALAQGLLAAGARVTDLGLCGTEEIYYAAANQPFDAGIMTTGATTRRTKTASNWSAPGPYR